MGSHSYMLKPKRPPNTSTVYGSGSRERKKKNIVCWGMLLFTLFHFTAAFHEQSTVLCVVGGKWATTTTTKLNGLRKIVGSKLFTELCSQCNVEWDIVVVVCLLLLLYIFLFRLFFSHSVTHSILIFFFFPFIRSPVIILSWELSFCGLNWISTQKKLEKKVVGMRYMIKYSKFTAV